MTSGSKGAGLCWENWVPPRAAGPGRHTPEGLALEQAAICHGARLVASGPSHCQGIRKCREGVEIPVCAKGRIAVSIWDL